MQTVLEIVKKKIERISSIKNKHDFDDLLCTIIAPNHYWNVNKYRFYFVHCRRFPLALQIRKN